MGKGGATVYETPWLKAVLTRWQRKAQYVEEAVWSKMGMKCFLPMLIALRLLLLLREVVTWYVSDVGSLLQLGMALMLPLNAVVLIMVLWLSGTRNDPVLMQFHCVGIFMMVSVVIALQTYTYMEKGMTLLVGINSVVAVQVCPSFAAMLRVPIPWLCVGCLLMVLPHLLLWDFGPLFGAKLGSLVLSVVHMQVERACFLDRCPPNLHRHRQPGGTYNCILEFENDVDQQRYKQFVLRRQVIGLCVGLLTTTFLLLSKRLIHFMDIFPIEIFSAVPDYLILGVDYADGTGIILVVGLTVYMYKNWDRINSDHRLVSSLSVVFFLCGTIHNGFNEAMAWEFLSITSANMQEVSLKDLKQEVVLVSMSVSISILQKHLSAILLYVPFTVTAAAVCVSLIPQIMIFLDGVHLPHVMSFHLFLVELKLLPIWVAYVFGNCFAEHFRNCVTVPNKKQLQSQWNQHEQQWWSLGRMLTVVHIGVGIACHSWFMRHFNFFDEPFSRPTDMNDAMWYATHQWVSI